MPCRTAGKIRRMSDLGLKTLTTILGFIGKPAWERANRDDRILSVLAKVGLDTNNPPQDFDGVYAFALLHYGADKPKPVLELFRDIDIKETLRRAFQSNDPAVLESAAEKLMDWNKLGDEVRSTGVDSQAEILAFFEEFRNFAKRSRRPAEMVAAHQLTEIDQKVDSLGQQLAELAVMKSEIAVLRAQIKTERDRYSDAELDHSEKHYRDLALESCDIIDLAGLPEDDRNIAMQKFVMRQLYVPLRLQVENKGGTDPNSWLVRLEEKRTAQRNREAGRAVHEGKRSAERAAIGAVLSESPRLVVLSDPGGGKTTILRWLATAYLLRLKNDLDWADLPDVATLPDRDWLPIVIRCRDLDGSTCDGTLDDVLKQTLRKAELSTREAEMLPVVLRQRLDRGNALLLIDGLDEIADPRQRLRFCRRIESFARVFTKAPIITTSRIVGYREMGGRIQHGFAHATLAELLPNDKDLFAQRWCSLTEPKERQVHAVKELCQDIHSSDRIERLTGNPMLLTTMALVKRKVGRLPNRRVDLYEQAVQVLLNWRREVDTPLDKREALPQLEYIAYEMCRRGEQRLTEPEVLELLDRMRQEFPNIRPIQNHTPDVFLQILERRTSLLIQSGQVRRDGHLVPAYEFRHLTFQEYLAGLALVEGRFPGHIKSSRLAERVAPLAAVAVQNVDVHTEVNENWREALRLCLACCNDDDADETLLTLLQPIGGESIAQTTRPRAILAGLCLADEPNVGEESGKKVLKAIIESIADHDGVGVVDTGIDQTCLEIATSIWRVPLRNLLLEQFLKQQNAEERVPLGGLISLMGIGRTLIEQDSAAIENWLKIQVPELASDEDSRSVSAALDIMRLYYSMEKSANLVLPFNNNLCDALLQMMKGSAVASHAAIWSLYWLTQKHSEDSMQALDSVTKERILDDLIQQNIQGYNQRYLCFIIGSFRNPKDIAVLGKLLNEENISVIQAALGAISEIGTESAVEVISDFLCRTTNGELSQFAIDRLYLIETNFDNTILQKYLSFAISSVRQWAALRAANSFADSRTRFLLSQDLDSQVPGWDPFNLVDLDRVKATAIRLRESEENIRDLYETIAEETHLRLAWKGSGSTG